MEKKKIKKYILIDLIIVLFLGLVYIIWYLNDYYRADEEVKDFLKSSNIVVVNKEDETYFFDGYGEENAIVFYQGGKVENISYAPLLYKLAESGIDCFLVKMPFNLAILDKNKASSVIYDEKYNYNNWYLMGHSLGGVVASMYSNSHDDKVSGLILLAAYPTSKVKESIRVLSIYGSNDGVLNLNKYNANKKYWNNQTIEHVIPGGNHANFGYYGKQSGDNDSTITREQQQEETINEILNFINN